MYQKVVDEALDSVSDEVKIADVSKNIVFSIETKALFISGTRYSL